ncbi:hypothetical protein HUJ04_012500 [Dendroctonus ponderosae]|nr:hypothetical protein HUJ04_012500 [Dendroctonus ponderosae]KAH1029730.1 hypothetical protein HUJ05_002908 [Dendroctonus ponderosae]
MSDYRRFNDHGGPLRKNLEAFFNKMWVQTLDRLVMYYAISAGIKKLKHKNGQAIKTNDTLCGTHSTLTIVQTLLANRR